MIEGKAALVGINPLEGGSLNGFSGVGSANKLGPELQPNSDMSQGVAGWTPVNTTIVAASDMGNDVVIITSLSTSFDSGQLAITGLTIGKTYRLVVNARQGAQGTVQGISFIDWGTIPQTPITTNTYQDYSFDVLAVATSGVTPVYANLSGGNIGDEVFVNSVSIREIF